MRSRKLLIGLALILLSLSTVFNYAMAVSFTPPTITVSVEDVNGDGLKDLKFMAMKEGLSFAGVHINVTTGISSGLTLFAGETDNNGSCLFFDVPGGTYRWVASDGAPSSDEIVIPTSEFSMTESEAVAWQTIAMNWIGESQDAGRALFEKMSRFVGFDPTGNPFSSLVGSTLLEYSQRSYQWLDKLQTYVVNLNRPELNLFNKMILPFKAVSLGFFEDTAKGVDFSKIERIQMQLVLNSSEESLTYAFANLFSNESIAGYHEIVKLFLSSGFEKTAWSALQPVLGALEHYNKPSFIDPSAYWDCSINSSDESLPSTLIGTLDMSKSVLSQTLDFLGYTRSALGALAKIVELPGKLLETISMLTTAVYVAYGVVVTVIFIFHWWDKYQTLGSFLFNLFQADPVLLVEVAMVAFNVAVCLFYLLIAPTLTIPGVGILFAIAGAILWIFYERANYANEIKEIEKQASIQITNLFKIRQSLRNIDVPSIKDSARTYGKAANLIAQFAKVAHQYSAGPDIEESFAESSANINVYTEQQLELANAVGNATLSLDNLLNDYLSWNGDNEQVRARLEGYNSTLVTYQHGVDNFQNDAVVGTYDGSSYMYQKKIVQAGDLEGTISFTTDKEIAETRYHSWDILHVFPYWGGWAFDEPTENDTKSNTFAVFYNVGKQPSPFEYKPKPDYMNYGYLDVTHADSGNLATFFEYKFHFTDGTTGYGFWEDPLRWNMWKQETLDHWRDHIAQVTRRFAVDLERVQLAMNAPVYEENSTSKPQNGNSWLNVTDSSSMSGQVMMASLNSANGGWLFGPYKKTFNGENIEGTPYYASFRLKTSSNISSGVVASIDVYDAGTVLQLRQIKANDFSALNSWQDFKLTFITPSSLTDGLEFRVRNWNNGVTDLYIDRITVYRGWNASTVYMEAAYNKPKIAYGGTPVSWARLIDSSSYSGIVLKASASNASGSWLYGPYTNSSLDGDNMRGKPYVASFRLEVLSNIKSNDVAYIDVCSSALGSVLKSKVIRANDFAASNIWQDFSVSFIVPDLSASRIEFRVVNLNNGVTDLCIDRITVYRGWNASTVYMEAAYNKPKITYSPPLSWTRLVDASSYSGLVLEAPRSSPSGSWLYGPYIPENWDQLDILGKPFTAVFTLKVSSRLLTNDVCYLDVYCGAGSTVLKSARVKASDFAAPNVWQDFKLSFIVPDPLTCGLEFRVVNLNSGITDLYIDKIELQKEWNDSTVYLQGAYNKPQIAYSTPIAWSKQSDPSSWSGIILKAPASSASGSWLYGPYIMTDLDGQNVVGKSFTAVFRFKVSSNLRTDDVAYIDVSCEQGKVILNSKKVRASDFAASDTWQDFQLTFTVPSSLNNGLEFRVVNLNSGIADLSVDIITIKIV